MNRCWRAAFCVREERKHGGMDTLRSEMRQMRRRPGEKAKQDDEESLNYTEFI